MATWRVTTSRTRSASSSSQACCSWRLRVGKTSNESAWQTSGVDSWTTYSHVRGSPTSRISVRFPHTTTTFRHTHTHTQRSGYNSINLHRVVSLSILLLKQQVSVTLRCQPAKSGRWAVEVRVFTHAHVSMITDRVDVYQSRPIGASLLTTSPQQGCLALNRLQTGAGWAWWRVSTVSSQQQQLRDTAAF